MAKLSITFNEDHIKLIKCLRFEQFDENRYGIDNYALWGGTYVYEQMALILGYADQALPEDTPSPFGPKYPKEIMDKLVELDEFIVGHIQDIEEILHQFCTEGIEVGQQYTCYDNVRIWYKGDIRKRK